jgi:hypothetical protein
MESEVSATSGVNRRPAAIVLLENIVSIWKMLFKPSHGGLDVIRFAAVQHLPVGQGAYAAL